MTIPIRPMPLPDSLLAELEDLVPVEYALVERILRLGKRRGKQRVPISEVGIVTELLKTDMAYDDFDSFQEVSTAKAPPVLKEYDKAEQIPLPTRYLTLDWPLSKVIEVRASRRDYSGGPITLAELSTLLHYSYGIRSTMIAYNTKDFPLRYAPTAGGLQSIELYVVVNAVENLEKGVYHFNADKNSLEFLERGNMRRRLVTSSMYQEWVHTSSAMVILTCVLTRLCWKYGRRAYRFAHLDAGIVAENLHLTATSLKIRSCMIAGFHDDAIHAMLRIDGHDEITMLLLALGKKP